MSFDVRQLRYAVAAADHRSFYRAAQALGLDQSHLSRNIRKLERVIGVDIFIRTRAGLKMTAAGEAFLHEARRIVDQSAHMFATARAAGQGRAGRLALGQSNPMSAGHLRATLLAWRESHPDVELDAIEENREALIAYLNSGALDLAVLTGEVSYRGIRRVSLWSERMLVALPVAHELAERETILWPDLRHETFLLTARDPGPELRDMLLGRLSAAGFRPDIRMHAVSRETIMSFLGDGLGVSVTCEGASGAHYPDVVLREVHGIPGQTLTSYSGYWRPGNENPVLKRFLAFLGGRYALSFDIG